MKLMTDDRKPASHRQKTLVHDIASHMSEGLEFGALSSPAQIPKGHQVYYVDYADKSTLMKHPHEDSVRKDDIVDIDFIWSGSGSLSEVVGKDRVFDFAIASHVIEHVPKVLGWFNGIYEVLRPGGVFNLAIPDRRYTFDLARHDSTIGEMVEAFLHGYTRPSIRQMFDHTYNARAIQPGEIWKKDHVTPEKLQRYSGEIALDLAMAQAKSIFDNNRYFDSHCWVLTPLSFLSLLEAAVDLQIFPFLISEILPTLEGDYEFFVSLRRTGINSTVDDLLAQQRWALGLLRRRIEAQRMRTLIAATP